MTDTVEPADDALFAAILLNISSDGSHPLTVEEWRRIRARVYAAEARAVKAERERDALASVAHIMSGTYAGAARGETPESMRIAAVLKPFVDDFNAILRATQGGSDDEA